MYSIFSAHTTDRSLIKVDLFLCSCAILTIKKSLSNILFLNFKLKKCMFIVKIHFCVNLVFLEISYFSQFGFSFLVKVKFLVSLNSLVGNRVQNEKFSRIREIIFNIFAIFIADVEAPLITNAAAELPTPAAQVIAKATAPKKTQ